MPYNKICAFSKKEIKANEKVKVVFLSMLNDNKNSKFFPSMPDFVSSWEQFQIVGFPLSAKVNAHNLFSFDNKKAANVISELINKKTGQAQNINEITDAIINDTLEGSTALREVVFSIMVISDTAFKTITMKNKSISFFDQAFYEENNECNNKTIKYEDSLKEKETYFNQIIKPKESFLLPQEKERLEDMMELIPGELKKDVIDKQINSVISRRFNVSNAQTPFSFIKFEKAVQKNPSLISILAEGFTNNVWISEAFDDLRIPFNPQMNTININHNEEMAFHFQEMAAILKREKSTSQRFQTIDYFFDELDGLPCIFKKDITERLLKGFDKKTKDAFEALCDKLPLANDGLVLDPANISEEEYNLIFDSELISTVFNNRIFKIK